MSKITLELFEVGSCKQIEKISIQNGKMRMISFPAMVGLIHHSTLGYILFDTGYSPYFVREATSIFATLYKIATPVKLEKEEELWEQLKKRNIEKQDIAYCIVSHFHADHIGELRSLHKDTKIIALQEAYSYVKELKGFSALKEAFIPELLPHTLDDQFQFLPKQEQLPIELKPYEVGYDIFGDKTIYAVLLDGHAHKQIGIYIKPLKIFLCADASWSLEAIKENIPPMKIAKLIKSDYKAYIENLSKLHQIQKNNKDIQIIPTHCNQTMQLMKGRVISE